MTHWSKDRIITNLGELSKTVGRSPSAREVGAVIYQACRRYFGSFNKAKQAAGLTIFPPKHHQINKRAKIPNKDLAYILGVVKGDGYCRIRITPDRSSGEILLGVKNLDFAQEFQRRIQRWSGVQPKFREKDGEFFVALYSIDAAKIIQSTKIEEIINLNRKIKANFLRGLYDSEGGVTGTNLDNRRIACRWIHFSNSDKEIIRTVSQLLKDFSINHRVKSRIHSGFGSKRLQYEILIFSLENFENFYRNIGFSIKYKNDKLLEVIRSYEKYRKK